MKALLISSLTVAIATMLIPMLSNTPAPQSPTTAFERSELISRRYTYRRYNSGTGRREILS